MLDSGRESHHPLGQQFSPEGHQEHDALPRPFDLELGNQVSEPQTAKAVSHKRVISTASEAKLLKQTSEQHPENMWARGAREFSDQSANSSPPPISSQEIASMQDSSRREKILKSIGLQNSNESTMESSASLDSELEGLDYFISTSKDSGSEQSGRKQTEHLQEKLLVLQRLKMLRQIVIIGHIAYTFVHLNVILNHEVTTYRIINSIFLVADIVGMVVLWLSFFPKFHCLKYCFHIFVYFNFNMMYRISDFEHMDHGQDANFNDAFRSCMFSAILVNIFIFILLFYDNRRKIATGFYALLVASIALIYKTYKCNDATMSKYALLWVCITVAISGLYWIFCILVFINMNNDTYTQIKKQQEAQQEFRIIFQNIEESLLIMQDGALNIVNNQFLTHFSKIIERFQNTQLGDGFVLPHKVDSEKRKPEAKKKRDLEGWCRLKQDVFGFLKDTLLWKHFSEEEKKECSLSQANDFINLKMFKEYNSKIFLETNRAHREESMAEVKIGRGIEESFYQVEFSIMEILKIPKAALEEKTFSLIETDLHLGVQQTSQQLSQMQYVKIKVNEYEMNGKQRVIIQFKDVSNDVLQDQFKNQNQLLELINACVSHELRNPLNSINAQNIEKEALYEEMQKIIKEYVTLTADKDPKAYEHEIKLLDKLKTIIEQLKEGWKIQDSSVEIMQFLVQDLLDYAQIKSGKFRHSLTKFNIMDAIDKVISIQKKKADDQGIGLSARFLNISEDCAQACQQSGGDVFSPMVCTDRSRVMQVLLGLQSNAIKFTESGEVTIEVAIQSFQDQKYLQVSVIDTGIGIKYEDQDKLFKLFGFIQDSKKLNTKGIGLGLVISDQIVSQFGGKITFKSTPGKGSVFSFNFKLANEDMIDQCESREKMTALDSTNLQFKWQPSKHKLNKESIPYVFDIEKNPEGAKCQKIVTVKKEKEIKVEEEDAESIEAPDLQSQVSIQHKTIPQLLHIPKDKLLSALNLEHSPRQILKSPTTRKKTGDVEGLKQPPEVTIPTMGDDDVLDSARNLENSRSYLRDEDLEFGDDLPQKRSSMHIPKKVVEDSSLSPHYSNSNDDFKLAITASEVGGAAVSREMEWVQEENPALANQRILMVDDQSFNLTALSIILKCKIKVDADSLCDQALSGQNALKMVAENVEQNQGKKCDYSLILMDCNMPQMDGYETTDLIRRYLYQRGLPQPIISAVTGHSEQFYIQKAIDSGMNQVMSKPVRPDLLANIVDRLGFKRV